MSKLNLLTFYNDAYKNAETKELEITRSYFIEYGLNGYGYIYNISAEIADLLCAVTRYRYSQPHLCRALRVALSQIETDSVGERIGNDNKNSLGR